MDTGDANIRQPYPTKLVMVGDKWAKKPKIKNTGTQVKKVNKNMKRGKR
jgi:hypothetical protein